MFQVFKLDEGQVKDDLTVILKVYIAWIYYIWLKNTPNG